MSGQTGFAIVHLAEPDGELLDIIDGNTRALVVVDYEHHEVHGGSHYTYTEVQSLDDGDAREILITTPDTTKWAHLVFAIDGALHVTVQFYEGATHAAGDALTAYNNNRNSDNLPTTTLAVSADDGVDGTLILNEQFGIDTGGGANRITSGGQSRGDSEWVLKQNEKYLLKITSLTNANELSIRLSWYEHTNR